MKNYTNKKNNLKPQLKVIKIYYQKAQTIQILSRMIMKNKFN